MGKNWWAPLKVSSAPVSNSGLHLNRDSISDLEKFPEFSNATPMQLRLNSGDVLYLPSFWFHHLRQSHGCVAVNFWYDMDYDCKWNYFNFLTNVVKLSGWTCFCVSWLTVSNRKWFLSYVLEKTKSSCALVKHSWVLINLSVQVNIKFWPLLQLFNFF